MLKVNGKEVVFSQSFVMAPSDDVVLKVPEIIARAIKIEINGTVTQHDGTTNAFGSDESNLELSVVKVPFADVGAFVLELEKGQLATVNGPATLRISGQSLGATAMLLHVDVHVGRYDNYTGE